MSGHFNQCEVPLNGMKKALGMMSGTSIDGYVSAAVLVTDGDNAVRRIATTEYCYEGEDGVRAIHHLSKAAELAYRNANGISGRAEKLFPDALREYVRTTFSLDESKVNQKLDELISSFGGNGCALCISDIVERSTDVHAKAAQHMLGQIGCPASEIDCVGYHGQTLYHDPFFNKVTVQVGEPQKLSDKLKIPVVFDFRSADVAGGGQGAPLAPAYHRALVRSAGFDAAAILNLGGTANVTVVSSKTEDMLGFDTGPANGLIDRYVKEMAGIALDKNSKIASIGKVSEGALRALVERSILLKDGRSYLELKPPKSLDIRDYTFDIPEFRVLSLEDGCATLNAFTAECVVLGVDWIEDAGFEVPSKWVLCGGGAYSPDLRNQLQERLNNRLKGQITLVTADDVGWSAQGMEAELFAYLAVRSMRGLPITFPGTTGVKEPTKGGRTFSPSRPAIKPRDD